MYTIIIKLSPVLPVAQNQIIIVMCESAELNESGKGHHYSALDLTRSASRFDRLLLRITGGLKAQGTVP